MPGAFAWYPTDAEALTSTPDGVEGEPSCKAPRPAGTHHISFEEDRAEEGSNGTFGPI